ncbi:MAG TPA: hypothetical protein VHG33_04280, partial [Woeseiaceae bacterium]|nr:hypothetical protein [Woeseiaceae bacterium]
ADQHVAGDVAQLCVLQVSRRDVLVCGNDASAREVVVGIAQDMGLKAWHAGAIDNSVVSEALTSVLIFMNKKYGLEGAGIRIVAKGGT